MAGDCRCLAALGAPSDLRERLHGYAEKAMREAGDHTTWTDPDEDYETAVHAAVDAAIDDAGGARGARRAGRPDRRRRVEQLPRHEAARRSRCRACPTSTRAARSSSVSLVDPDNRRPVDFDAAAGSLADGSVDKQRVTSTALRLRRDRPELFTGYTPLVAEGPAADHVLAFDRGGVVTVSRGCRSGWRRGWLGRHDDRAAGGAVAERARADVVSTTLDWRSLAARPTCCADLPVALLVRED